MKHPYPFTLLLLCPLCLLIMACTENTTEQESTALLQEIALSPPTQPLELDVDKLKIILAAQANLSAKHQIAVTTDTVRQFARENIDINPLQFDDTQLFGRKLLAASEEVALLGRKPEEVAERYTDNFGDFRFWFSTLSTVTKEDIPGMRKRIYESYDAMIEDVLPEYRLMAEKKALADIILPASESQSRFWKQYLYQYLLTYGEEHNLKFEE
jgi:hypothetical protein